MIIVVFDQNFLPILLSPPALESNLIDIICGSYHTVVVYDNGNVYTCGYNSDGELAVGDTDDRYVFTQTKYINDSIDASDFSANSINDFLSL